MNVFASIIEWAKWLKPWEQEAVRRLVVNGEVTDSDETEIIKLLKEPPTNKSLDELKIPDPQPSSASPVSLVTLKHETGVNALAPGQILEFVGPTGLTAIYGDNGSGKSGYSRILKRACRSRHAQPKILHDVYSGISTPPAAKAEFVFRDGVTEGSEVWTDGSPVSEALASIAVFDSECARLYVEEEGNVAYRPYGLEVFDQLGACYRRIKKRLLDEATAIQAPRCPADFLGPIIKAAVEAAKDSDSEETITTLRKLGTLSDSEKEQASRLQEQVTQLTNADPKKLALAYRTLADSLDLAVQGITLAQETLRSSVGALPDAMKRASESREQAVRASKIAFSNEPVTGVGSEQWKTMFEDARTFSMEVAYPDLEFPVVGEGSRCVLCHQTLDEAARERLVRFADYIGNKAEARARESAAAYNALRTAAIDGATKICIVETSLIHRISEKDEVAGKTLGSIRDSYLSWRTAAGAVSSPEQWSKLAIPPTDTTGMTRLAAKLKDEAVKLDERSAPEALNVLTAELEAFKERIALSKVLSTIVEASVCGGKKRRLLDLASAIDTSSLSRQALKIAKEVITDALCEALHRELDSLNGFRLSVEFAKKGESGDVLHFLRLRKAPRGTKIEDILSEGEHRCLAIAAFLAELNQSGHKSAIVLDDPVSSLDHKYRDAVATRLVEEAKSRQVVVFTHDLAFLYAIHQAAAEAQVTMRTQALARTAQGTGVPVDGLYPEAMSLNDLIKHLRTLANDVKTMDVNDPDRRGRVADCYDLIRAAWERVVEATLLCSTVGPFEKDVHTQKLRGVEVTDEDHKTVFWAMKRASSIVEAHRKPAAGGTTTLPKDTDLMADIDALDAYHRATAKRATQVVSRRKLLESPPTLPSPVRSPVS